MIGESVQLGLFEARRVPEKCNDCKRKDFVF